MQFSQAELGRLDEAAQAVGLLRSTAVRLACMQIVAVWRASERAAVARVKKAVKADAGRLDADPVRVEVRAGRMLVAEIDKVAKAVEMSRAAFIRVACAVWVERQTA